MTTKTKTPSTYYVKCATQAERDALLDYAVARGAKEWYGKRIEGRCNAFLSDEPKAVWASAGGAKVELTPDSFRRKVRKLWPVKAKATAKKVVKKPAAKAPRKVSTTDAIAKMLMRVEDATERIEQALSLIRSGMETCTEGSPVKVEVIALKPAGLQPGDYCKADEHHTLKEVAERLTAMGWEWNDIDRHTYQHTACWGRVMVNKVTKGYGLLLPTPEFLSRAEVTAKELGLTPVVPEPWVQGDYFTHEDGSVDRVRYERDGFIHSYDGFRSYHVSRCRKMSPAEVQAHQAAIAAKEEAARVPKFGSRVEYQDDKEWVVATHKPSPGGHWVVSKKWQTVTAKRHEFKILP